MLPYGYTNEYSPHYNDLVKVAEAATFALKSTYNTEYLVGISRKLVYAAHGASTDYAHKIMKVKFSYTLELRPAFNVSTYPEGFLLPVKEVEPTLKETWKGLVGMSNAISKSGASNVVIQDQFNALKHLSVILCLIFAI